MMHHHSSFGKVLSFLVSLLLIFAAIIIGLHALNINFFDMEFMRTSLSPLVKPLQIAIGIAGILGLVYLFTIPADCKYCRKCQSCDAPHSHR